MDEDETSRFTTGKQIPCPEQTLAAADSALVSGCLKGDMSAWNTLISRYQGFIFGAALRLGLSTPDAEDVFQNVCVKLYQHLGELRDVQRLSSWLASVTQREVAQLFRKQSPRQFSGREPGQNSSEATQLDTRSPALTPEEEILAWERQHIIRQSLTHLPDECRRLLTLLYGSEPACSYTEAAKTLAIPVGSVGPKRARCLAQMRVLLEKSGY